MTQEQLILFKRSLNIYNTEIEAWTALDNLIHTQGQPVVAFFRRTSNTHGDTALGAIFAIGTANGVGKYKACSSHDDMLTVLQALNTHISEWTAFKDTFDKMFEYDANHKAIKAKLDFYTDSNKNISAGGLGGSGSSSLGALYQLVDVMINSTGDGVEGAVEGSVLAYDATAGKWKAIAQSEILPDMGSYYTKDETNSAINNAKSNLQGQVDTLKALIPATATADNQLTDKDFVNSSIATATAEFRGSFTSLDELKATSGNLNDYAFYLHNDSVGNSIVDRYKWTTAGWLYEYTLNNSSFTAEQWAALNSAITATLVQSYNSHLNNTTIHITSAERTAWNNKWDYDEEIIKAVKVNAAVLSDSATKLATARKIWGKYFDGSADVSGDLTEVGNITASGKATIQGDIVCGGEVVAVAGEGTPVGVTDYSALTGKPSINGVTLVSGNNTLAALGIQAAGDYATNSGVTTLLANYADKTFVSNNYVGKSAFNNHISDTNIHITAAERDAWNAKWDYNEATIKAVKVNSASSADSVAWSGITGKPTTFTPSAHTHTASDVSGLPTSLKNPYALTFGSKSYDGSAAATITASDFGALTSITKSMVEGVLTGDITSHTHSYLPLSGGTIKGNVYISGNDVTNTPFNILTSSAGNTGYIRFGAGTSSSTELGHIGFSAKGVPAMHYQGVVNTLIHAGNYNSYSPKLDGTGASGTWGISISGNAATATNADTLDGYHSYAFRKDWDTRAGGSYIGWVRIMKWTVATAGTFSPQSFLLSLYREYNSPAPEAYTLSFTFGWNTANIVQLNGNGGNRIIEKFRISKTADQLTYYLEYYVNPTYSTYVNPCYCIISSCYNFGSVELINEVASGDTSTLHEITTKLNSIVGNIEGNASSATKLATPRTLWGQSFDGSADVSGAMSGVDAIVSNTTDGYFVGNRNNRLGVTTGGLLLYSYNATPMSFYTNGTERMCITADGNILIGTTTNQNSSKLQVNGSINTTTGYRLGALDILTRRTNHLAIGEETTVYASSPTHIYGTDVILKYSTSRYIGFTLNSSGNVTIGASDLASTTTKLYVDGTGHYSGDLIVDGEVSALVA